MHMQRNPKHRSKKKTKNATCKKQKSTYEQYCWFKMCFFFCLKMRYLASITTFFGITIYNSTQLILSYKQQDAHRHGVE